MEYRLYFRSEESGRFTHRIDLECENDEQAIRVAADHDVGASLELWQGARLLGIFPARCPAGGKAS